METILCFPEYSVLDILQNICLKKRKELTKKTNSKNTVQNKGA
jgi:hypothetical protein